MAGKHKLERFKLDDYNKLKAEGLSINQIATKLGITRQYLHKLVKTGADFDYTDPNYQRLETKTQEDFEKMIAKELENRMAKLQELDSEYDMKLKLEFKRILLTGYRDNPDDRARAMMWVEILKFVGGGKK
jgi:hypothetical protein